MIGLTWRAAPLTTLGYGLTAVTGAATPIAVAWLLKLIIDQLARSGSLPQLLGLAAGLALAGVVAAVLPQLGAYLRAETGRSVALVAEDELYLAVERFAGLARFEDPIFLDRLRLAQQGAAMPVQVIEAGFGLMRGTLTLIGFVGSLAFLSPLITAVVLLTAVPTLLAELALSRRRAGVLWQIGPSERRELFYRSLLDSAHSAKEIRLFGIGGFLRGRMLDERRVANAALRRVDRREMLVQGGLTLLGAVVAGVGLVWAIQGARAGRLSIGDVSIVIAALAGVQSGVNTLVNSVAQAHEQLLLFDHYVAVTAAPVDLPTRRPPAALRPLRLGIDLRDVWFRYSEEHPWVLRGVNLHIPAGAAVALVGLNGAGKSTIVKLLCRFYDPSHGTILWDGMDLRDVEVAQLRERIGAVFQDYMEYDLSAAENIALGDLAALADRRRVEAAARRAGVHAVLTALPQGYDTQLTRIFFGESDQGDAQTGVRLSGGQWQRLALARAFLRDQRDLMILDEPSAGLDAAAEHEVHSRLRQHRSGRTSVLISHRLGSVRDADLIVVLNDGRITEQGSHAELMAAGGDYAQLFRLQAAGYQEEPLVLGGGDR
ncbi:MAG TPA: ABC transporter ATP-binding protein [Micromonosporaceae bacterium]|nr:ABC transporter ATP-binding protein [Micromonosporaceae bacterium]